MARIAVDGRIDAYVNNLRVWRWFRQGLPGSGGANGGWTVREPAS
jgi:hypothetical protein